MKKLALAFVFAGFFSAYAEENTILVTPQWLNEHSKDPGLVIVQINSIKYDYINEHIIGAHYLWPESLAPNTPDGNMNVPDAKKATQVLEELGISNSSHVVLCYVRNEIPAAARMFLTLEYLGLKGKVSMLNGGVDEWKKAGFPVSKDLPSTKPGKFTIAIDPVIVDRFYVADRLTAPGTVVVDCRPSNVYNGDPVGYPRDGHIAGAKSLPFTELFDATNTIKPDDQLQAYFNSIADSKSKELVTYCFIGQTASVVYLAGRELGYSMKLYDGSAQEWSRYKELPMEVTPKTPSKP